MNGGVKGFCLKKGLKKRAKNGQKKSKKNKN
jgi:hypothetical protein